MGRRLQSIEVEEGIFLTENACENYRCRCCGARMISVNFVNGLCVQVFVSHGMDCVYAEGNLAERTIDVSCATCSFYSAEKGCCCGDESDSRIASVRSVYRADAV
ncbi:MAG: hypothetical protein IJH77_03040 [Mogibacterium sp.]|nr:hypothetical protein [Mogibacterium sp.]